MEGGPACNSCCIFMKLSISDSGHNLAAAAPRSVTISFSLIAFSSCVPPVKVGFRYFSNRINLFTNKSQITRHATFIVSNNSVEFHVTKRCGDVVDGHVIILEQQFHARVAQDVRIEEHRVAAILLHVYILLEALHFIYNKKRDYDRW